jgi:pyridoxal phosphate enzyme (YggS family)
MIGHLQRNKVNRTLPIIDCLHSLDSLRLAKAISEQLQVTDSQLGVLVEVNISGDASKTGLPAEQASSFIGEVARLPGLKVKGLMAMTTLGATPNEARREFAAVRELRDQLTTQFGSQVNLGELSMGMSGDFAEAIAEGATMVRVGTRLWQGVL